MRSLSAADRPGTGGGARPTAARGAGAATPHLDDTVRTARARHPGIQNANAQAEDTRAGASARGSCLARDHAAEIRAASEVNGEVMPALPAR